MKDTAPKWQGVAAVSALFGVIAAGVSLVVYEYAFPGAFLIGLLVALIVAILLWLGWRDANAEPIGARDLSAEASKPRVSAGATAGGVAAAGAAGAAVATGAVSGDAAATAAAAKAKADAAAAKAKADAAAAKAKADAAKSKADAAAAKAKADAAKAKADADTAAAKAKADAAAAKKKADAAAKKKADAAAKASAAKAAKTGDVDYDGDGVIEGKNEGKRPAALKGPRGGKADDLKQIKGVGPKMEKMCNSLGFYHFDQIAGWSKDEIAWVDANLEGFKGRVTRDTWVKQAKILAAGGTTEFSKKVDKGGVY